MKKITTLVLALLIFPNVLSAKEYQDVKITSVIFEAKNSHIDFTIDKKPSYVFSTKSYKEDSQDYVVSMIVSAFKTKQNISYLRVKDFNAEKANKVLPLKSMKFGQEIFEEFSDTVSEKNL
jgi:hypothetical protein